MSSHITRFFILEWMKTKNNINTLFKYDVALITLKAKFKISPKISVNPICLPMYMRKHHFGLEPYIALDKDWNQMSFRFIGEMILEYCDEYVSV